MRRFLVIALTGRLGNHLFQFASGYGLARTLGADLLFDSAQVDRHDLLLPRLIGPLYREATRVQLLRVGVDHISRWPGVSYRLMARTRRASGRTPAKVTIDDYRAPGRYRAGLKHLDLPAWLQACLQTERYFSHVADEITEAITFPTGAPRLAPSSRPTVAVSFRRGDYVDLGWTLPWKYYDDALKRLVDRIPDPRLVLFGDDPAFVEQAARRLSKYGTVENALELGEDPVSQLALMTQCDHAVIANSSFAWWGAWLGDQRDRSAARVVIAPAEYESGGDLLPKRWTGLSTELEMKLPLSDGSTITLSGA
jgi:hypothetical protein